MVSRQRGHFSARLDVPGFDRAIVTGSREPSAIRVVGHGSSADAVYDGRYDAHGLSFVEGIVVRTPPGINLVPGQMLVTSGSVREYREFEARLSFRSGADGGRASLLSVFPEQALFEFGRPLPLAFRSAEADLRTITTSIELTVASDRQTIRAEIELMNGLALEVGQRFRILDGDGRIAGAGVVTRLVN